MRDRHSVATSSCKALVVVKQPPWYEQGMWKQVFAASLISAMGVATVYGLETYLDASEMHGLETLFKLS